MQNVSAITVINTYIINILRLPYTMESPTPGNTCGFLLFLKPSSGAIFSSSFLFFHRLMNAKFISRSATFLPIFTK